MEEFSTNDMAMATYLRMEGHPVQRCEWPADEESCLWFFYATESLMISFNDFTGGTALVEPRRYNREFGATKREFYKVSATRTASTTA